MLSEAFETPQMFSEDNINGLVQDCGIPRALAMELLQSCAKPSMSVTYSKNCAVVTVELIRVCAIQINIKLSSLLLLQCEITNNYYDMIYYFIVI